jgi:hypothetical protein
MIFFILSFLIILFKKRLQLPSGRPWAEAERGRKAASGHCQDNPQAPEIPAPGRGENIQIFKMLKIISVGHLLA